MSIELREEARRRERERLALAKERETLIHDVRALASKDEGRRFFRWLLRQGGLFRDDYLSGAAGAHAAGRRSLALRLWRLLEESLSRETFVEVAAAILLETKDGAPPDAGPDGPENSVTPADESYV